MRLLLSPQMAGARIPIVRWGVLLVGLLASACGLAPTHNVDVPPVGETAQAPTRPPAAGPAAAPPLALGPARPAGGGIAIAPERGDEAQAVPPTPLLAGRPTPAALAPRAPARAAAAQAADVTLNFEEADIRDVLAFVLRDVLKRNYVVDPDVAGTITLGVSRPITRESLLPTLEAVLNSRGATMVETDGLIRVSRLREGGKLSTTPPFAAGGAAGQAVQVLTLRFATPSEIAKLLEPVLAQGRVLMADDARRLLLVQANASELEMVRDTLAIFDVDQLAGTSVAMVLLRYADSSELVPELSSLFGAVRKATDNGVIRFVPIERLNAVIILAREPRYMEEARAWIGRLDRVRRGNDPRLYVYHVQHGKAVEVANTLQGAFARDEAPEPAARKPAPLPDFSPTGVPAGAPPGYVGSPPIPSAPAQSSTGETGGNPGEAPDGAPVRAAAARIDTGGIRIRADEANNSLLIRATPREFAQVLEVLEQIDIPPLQVLIEATIAEVTLNDELRYGIQYYLNSGKSNFLFTRNQQNVTPISPGLITPELPGFAYTLNVNAPKVILDALSQITQTNVISTPRVLVLDNQSARLQVGNVVPIVTQTAVSTLTNAPLTVNSVQYRDTGVVIEVTPHVNASGFITLDTTQSVSDVVNTTTSNIDSPTFRQRRLRTSAGVQSGSTILLGGLIQEDSTRSNTGLPVLSDIPVVGALFGTRDFATDRTEMIVLLTPRVVRNQAEADDMTNTIKRKFQAVLLLEPGVMPQPRRPKYP